MTDLPDLPEVNLSPCSWTVGEYLVRDDPERSGKWQLDAPYQRGSVWTEDQRRNLIRSLLMGVPVGTIVYAKLAYGWIPEEPYAYARVIDGKQRIEAVRAWYNDEFTCPGWWFSTNYMPEELRRRDLYCSEVPYSANIERVVLPGLEFDATTYAVPNPDYVKGLRSGYNGVKRGDPRLNLYRHVRRTNEEALAAEAEVFLLINFGGVEQAEVDRERASNIAQRYTEGLVTVERAKEGLL